MNWFALAGFAWTSIAVLYAWQHYESAILALAAGTAFWVAAMFRERAAKNPTAR